MGGLLNVTRPMHVGRKECCLPVLVVVSIFGVAFQKRVDQRSHLQQTRLGGRSDEQSGQKHRLNCDFFTRPRVFFWGIDYWQSINSICKIMRCQCRLPRANSCNDDDDDLRPASCTSNKNKTINSSCVVTGDWVTDNRSFPRFKMADNPKIAMYDLFSWFVINTQKIFFVGLVGWLHHCLSCQWSCRSSAPSTARSSRHSAVYEQ